MKEQIDLNDLFSKREKRILKQAKPNYYLN